MTNVLLMAILACNLTLCVGMGVSAFKKRRLTRRAMEYQRDIIKSLRGNHDLVREAMRP